MKIMNDKILRERFLQLLKNSITKNTARLIVVVGKEQYLVENFSTRGRDLLLVATVKLG